MPQIGASGRAAVSEAAGPPSILRLRGSIVTVSAQLDGEAIVRDEPLDLPANQALMLQNQAVGA